MFIFSQPHSPVATAGRGHSESIAQTDERKEHQDKTGLLQFAHRTHQCCPRSTGRSHPSHGARYTVLSRVSPLTELISIAPGALADYIPAMVPGIQFSLG